MEDEIIQKLNDLKKIHLRNLYDLEEKAAKFGDLYVPPYIKNEIKELKIKIAEIEERLINLNLDIGDNEQPRNYQDDLVNLRVKLITHFNLEELHTLCFDLGIESENFSSPKEGFVRELISYNVRRGSMPKLVDYCRRMRPNVSWSG